MELLFNHIMKLKYKNILAALVLFAISAAIYVYAVMRAMSQ